jgi:hypothetical protein
MPEPQGSALTTPVVAGDTAYVVLVNGQVQSLDARTGNQIWTFRRQSPNSNDLRRSERGGLIGHFGHLDRIHSAAYAECVARALQRAGQPVLAGDHRVHHCGPDRGPVDVAPATLGQKMQVLQPRLKELQQKYGKDREKLSQEQMKLYKEAGVNPMGGCLPLLVQFPIWIGLYQSIIQALGHQP